MARQYTLGERAIIYSAILCGATYEEVNIAVAQEQLRTKMSPRIVPESSYKMVKYKYLPQIGPDGLWDQIQNPKTIGQVIKENK